MSAIMQKKWHAKSYEHFLSEVAIVWNDKQDQWEQQFMCTRYVFLSSLHALSISSLYSSEFKVTIN